MSNKFEEQAETRTPEQILEGLSAEVRGKLERLVREYFDSHSDKGPTSTDIDEIVSRVITEEKEKLSIATHYLVGESSALRRTDLSK